MEEMRDGGDLIPWMDGLPVRTIRVGRDSRWVALGDGAGIAPVGY